MTYVLLLMLVFVGLGLASRRVNGLVRAGMIVAIVGLILQTLRGG